MKHMITAALIVLICVTPARGMAVEGLDELYQQAEEYGVTPEDDLELGLGKLAARVPEVLEELFTAGLRTALKVLAVVLMCALGNGTGSAGQSNTLASIRLAGALSITALTMTDVSAMIGLGWDTVGRMNIFSGVLLPVMAVLSAVSGSVSASAVRQSATVLFSKGLMSMMEHMLIPMVYAYVCVSCARAAAGNPGLDKLAKGIKSLVTGILSVLLLVFVGYLTASGAIAGSADLSRVKAARMAISRAIPVVGSILADASETVLAGAGVLRGTVGATGLLVVLAICLTPFLRLGVQYLLYKGTAALCATIAQPELARLVDAIGSAFGLVLGMTGAAALILMVSVVSAILAVTG